MAAAEAVREFWRLMGTNDFLAVGTVLADDFVLEWPQSNERIRGGLAALHSSTSDSGRSPMLVKKTSSREWQATDYSGIERCLFRNNETGGRSSVVRLTRGSRFPRHAHEGTEEVVVLSGAVRIGEIDLTAGDYLFTSPGEEHDVVAVSDATIFVSSQRRTPVVE